MIESKFDVILVPETKIVLFFCRFSSHSLDPPKSNRQAIPRSFDSKRSEAFERLHMYIGKNSKESYDSSSNDYSTHLTSKSSSSPTPSSTSNGHRAQKSTRNHQDNDQPLRMVQRLHN